MQPTEKKPCTQNISSSSFSIFGKSNSNVAMNSTQIIAPQEKEEEKSRDCMSNIFNTIVRFLKL